VSVSLDRASRRVGGLAAAAAELAVSGNGLYCVTTPRVVTQ
jgi:hypothetical protein